MVRDSHSIRCINVVNFIRGVEPRFATDLLLPVRKQMELILEHRLPATWLLQFDALVAGPFVGFLKGHMAKDHEVGFWFEMNEMLCKAAEVEWRGRPGFEWDHLPPVAFTIGYTPEERIKLADTAMQHFKSIWGRYPSSVASWNLDSITIAHLTERYGVDAYAVCRDQIATDGFTIWGAPIAGYYPSKTNCWSPALDRKNQIDAPIFRMLGQDPVYYYDTEFKLPSGRVIREPDTMEPTWTSGQSPEFVKNFLHMISDEPTLKFAYAQLGQENSFPWEGTAEGYPMQMKALAHLRDAGSVHVETMGESGRRFKRSFRTTPPQAQVMLNDPFGNTDPAEKSIWYQSRFYRADLHIKGDLAFLRDLTVYSDRNPQPFLNKATRLNDVEQRMPAILDGFHWRKGGEKPGAGGFLELDGQRMRMAGEPRVREEGGTLTVDLPMQGGTSVNVRFEERQITIHHSARGGKFGVVFEWDPSKSAFVGVEGKRAKYRHDPFEYSVEIRQGTASASPEGWTVLEEQGSVALHMAQAD
ncbi:hypothetical protein [Fimbriimonas ginsengisoli]|uniref:Uncharacterized protein n=1 Tax=Fimbriimonas ginsengisoli Gsoil 348 TaxID=661478 RepID=A0A068NYS3_FIMGI|nr:hypothetical protein [Fimbriimonas ginsengisoli]AIE87324.1 hypothetical protein OP10G_3956 [Fimbriimonas ginsengisoli Gsoil 348]